MWDMPAGVHWWYGPALRRGRGSFVCGQLCNVAVQDIDRAQTELEAEANILHQQGGIVIGLGMLPTAEEIEERNPR